MELHEKIKQYRKLKNMSQYDLAEKLNITQNTISLMENGKADLTLSRLYELAKIFEVTIYDLIGYPEGREKTDSKSLERLEQKIKDLENTIKEVENKFLKEKVTYLETSLQLSNDLTSAINSIIFIFELLLIYGEGDIFYKKLVPVIKKIKSLLISNAMNEDLNLQIIQKLENQLKNFDTKPD